MKKSIQDIDKNFKLSTACGKEIKWYDCKESFLGLTGIVWSNDDKTFLRIPRNVAENVSGGVCFLNSHTAGGKLRFSTNSPYVAIKPVYSGLGKMGHFAPSGSIGFDLYNEDNPDNITYMSSFIPPYDIKDSYEGLQNLSGDGLFHQYHINQKKRETQPVHSCTRQENAALLSVRKYCFQYRSYSFLSFQTL